MIKHLVLSGGGTIGCNEYGILRASHDDNYWNIHDIETIYGTSVGAIIGTILCLKLEWELLDKFIIQRPWQKVFKIDVYTIIESFHNLGILHLKTIREIFSPLFNAREISLDINMRDFYDNFGIELHVFTTELENYELIDISYKTHPEWKVLEAVYASCSLPFLFSPFMKENTIYLDGGLQCNYPLLQCYERVENKDEIFAIKAITDEPIKKITKGSSLFDYIIKIILTIIEKSLSTMETKEITIKNEIEIQMSMISIYDIYLATTEKMKREELINQGKQSWKEYSNRVIV